MRILVTGATGFVGTHLVRALAETGHELRIAVRSAPAAAVVGASYREVVGEIGPETPWLPALEGCDTVLHLAAQVPAPGVAAARFDTVNNLGTKRLSADAARAGVERLVLLSTALADPESSGGSAEGGDSPYARSKQAAEAHVLDFAAAGRTGLVLRPPMVYGAGAKGNWALLERLAASPAPLPLGAIRNRRSIIAVENLVDAVLRVALAGPIASKSGTYAVADERAVSIADLLAWLRMGMGRSQWLWPVPKALVETVLRVLGQGRLAGSLLGDLEVDSTPFRRAFDWSPPLSSAEAVMAAGRRYVGRAPRPQFAS